MEKGDGFVAAAQDGFLAGRGLGNLVLEEVGADKRVVATDTPVFAVFLVANALVGNVELRQRSAEDPCMASYCAEYCGGVTHGHNGMSGRGSVDGTDKVSSSEGARLDLLHQKGLIGLDVSQVGWI